MDQEFSAVEYLEREIARLEDEKANMRAVLIDFIKLWRDKADVSLASTAASLGEEPNRELRDDSDLDSWSDIKLIRVVSQSIGEEKNQLLNDFTDIGGV